MKIDRLDLCMMLAATLTVSFQLFVPPIVGMANNGDFHKVIAGFSLAGDERDEYKFIDETLHFSPHNYIVRTWRSSEQLLALFAIGLNSIFARDNSFDLRAIGLVHACIYLLTFWLALPLLKGLSKPLRVLCGFLIVLVFGDVLYVSQLNSFYMDTAALVFLLASTVFACRVLAWARRRDAIGLIVSLLLMAVSKAQHAPLALPAALLLSVCPSVLLPGFSKLARVLAIALLMAGSVYTYDSTHWSYKAMSLFSEIFYRVLPRAVDPSTELRMLGLDEAYRSYIGMHAYSSNSPMGDDGFVKGFISKTSYARLGIFFLRRPGRALDLLIEGMAEAGRQRPYMGSYDRSAGLPESTESKTFSLWSAAKARLLETRGATYLGYVLILAIAFWSRLWTGRRLLPSGSLAAGSTLIIIVFLALLIAILCDGVDPIRHSLVFTGLSDLMLVALVVSAATTSSSPTTSA